MIHDKYFDILERVAVDVIPIAAARLAAMIVYKNEIISIGTNKKKSHPLQRKYASNEDSIYLHAEIDAIKNAMRNIDPDLFPKCTMYVLRVKRPHSQSNEFIRGLAKPCCGCNHAVDQFGFKKVYYTTDEGYSHL